MALSRCTASLVAVGCLLGASAAGQSPARGQPCAGNGTSISIDTRARKLYLCEQGSLRGEHRISIGKGGTAKRRRGDHKTPIGTFPLGKPRASKAYKLFIPIGYPTAAQRKQGFTGGAIGIHGPKRELAWAGALSSLVDWTQGCIAVGRDQEIARIAAWVRKQRPALVRIY